MGRVVFDLAAQVMDERIDRSRRRELFVAPDLIQDIVPADHLALARDQQFQQPEFLGREAERLPPFGRRLSFKVDADISEGKFLDLGGLGLAPAQYGPDPGQEFPGSEGLEEIIIGPQFEAHDFIQLLHFSAGQHDDRRRNLVPAELPADLQASQGGKDQVEGDQVRGSLQSQVQTLPAVPRGDNGKTVFLQGDRQGLSQGVIILDEQDFLHGVCPSER